MFEDLKEWCYLMMRRLGLKGFNRLTGREHERLQLKGLFLSDSDLNDCRRAALLLAMRNFLMAEVPGLDHVQINYYIGLRIYKFTLYADEPKKVSQTRVQGAFNRMYGVSAPKLPPHSQGVWEVKVTAACFADMEDVLRGVLGVVDS